VRTYRELVTNRDSLVRSRLTCAFDFFRLLLGQLLRPHAIASVQPTLAAHTVLTRDVASVRPSTAC